MADIELDIDDDEELEIDSEVIDPVAKPKPIVLDLAGKNHTFHWSKDHHWIVYYSALNEGKNMYLPALDLLAISAGHEWMIINRRLQNDADPLDATDLLSAVMELTIRWESHTIIRMEEIGVKVPKQVKERIGNRKQRRVAKAPVSSKRR